MKRGVYGVKHHTNGEMAYTHGGNIYKYDKRPIDFSANINPLGMPMGIKKAIIDAVDSFDIYPDPYSNELREKLSKHHNVLSENIVLGNGAADLIYRITLGLKPKKSAVLAPTFSEYEKALRLANSQIEYINLGEDLTVGDYILDVADQVDMIFVCNPNNPTGMVVDKNMMIRLSNKCKECKTYLVVDECFLDFVVGDFSIIGEVLNNPYLIILKAFTKTYAMAGIRLGYIVINSCLAEDIHNLMQPWSVSTVAQKAGVAALNETDFVAKTVDYVDKEREKLTQILRLWGAKVYESKCNYILFYTERDVFEGLLKEGILIRDCSNYVGLGKGFYRIAVRSENENLKFKDALTKIL